MDQVRQHDMVGGRESVETSASQLVSQSEREKDWETGRLGNLETGRLGGRGVCGLMQNAKRTDGGTARLTEQTD